MTEKNEEGDRKNIEAYLQAILNKFNKERYRSLNTYLANPTNGSIRDKIVSILTKGENIDFENVLKGFLDKYKVKNREELIDIASKSIDSYRAIQRLLLGKTRNGKNNSNLLQLTAFLVELEKEDYNANKLDDFDINNTKEVSDSKNNDLKQTNIISAFNSSRIIKPKGKIKQLNFFSFRNKQVIDNKNKDSEE